MLQRGGKMRVGGSDGSDGSDIPECSDFFDLEEDLDFEDEPLPLPLDDFDDDLRLDLDLSSSAAAADGADMSDLYNPAAHAHTRKQRD